MSTPAQHGNRFNGRIYPFELFDKHLALKPPLGLIVCLVLLCRDFLLALVSTLGSLKGGGKDMSMLISHEQKWVVVAGMAPALLVLWAYFHRVPKSGGFARWVWKNGALLLSAAVVIQCIPAILTLSQGRGFGEKFFASPWILPLAAWMVAYLFGSKRVRDTFADFPEP